MKKYFKTSDMSLASFLKANNIDLREVTRSKEDQKRCEFVFRISPDDKYLLNLLDKWENSVEASNIKRVLYASKLIKKSLKEFLTSEQWYG